MKKRFTLCLFHLITILWVNGQTKTIEQLKGQIAASRTTAQRLQALLQLSDQRQSLSTEALRRYAFAAHDLSRQVADPLQKALADYFVATYYVTSGQLDSAMLLCNQNLAALSKQTNDSRHTWLKFAALKAQVLVKNNQYTEAISNYYQTLSEAERSNDTLLQMIAKNGIGWVNMEMAQYTEALRWFYTALKTTPNPKWYQKTANIYSNMAAVYTATNRFDSADKYIRKAIAYATAEENLLYLSNGLNILADNFIRQNKPSLAREPLQQAARIREQIGDPFYIVSDLSQLALFYAEQGQPQEGIAASIKGIGIARQYGLLSKLPFLQFALARSYKAAGDYRLYGETMEKVLALKDSVYQQNTEKELAGIRASYQQQKQQNLIIQQELAISKRNTVIYGVLVVVFFGVVISLILFTNYRRKQRQVVERLKEEEKRKTEQAVMMAQEAERRRISADLHDNLGAYATAISSNVDDLLINNGTGNKTVYQNIKSNADDILNSLNETIWVLNKTEIHLTNLCDRFKNYVARISDSYPDILININETITENTLLSPEATLNLLRIMQEAFHNAIRHSRGNCITVDIKGGPQVEISIADNGVGLNGVRKKGGHGLSNMEKRAKANGWRMVLESESGKGTVVKLNAGLIQID